MVRLLLEAGADPTIATNDGMTPMDIARRYGHDICVELLEVREVYSARPEGGREEGPEV